MTGIVTEFNHGVPFLLVLLQELNGPANSWYKASIAELRSKTGEERWSKRLERTFRKVDFDGQSVVN